jgi:hypothetical protein
MLREFTGSAGNSDMAAVLRKLLKALCTCVEPYLGIGRKENGAQDICLAEK